MEEVEALEEERRRQKVPWACLQGLGFRVWGLGLGPAFRGRVWGVWGGFGNFGGVGGFGGCWGGGVFGRFGGFGRFAGFRGLGVLGVLGVLGGFWGLLVWGCSGV